MCEDKTWCVKEGFLGQQTLDWVIRKCLSWEVSYKLRHKNKNPDDPVEKACVFIYTLFSGNWGKPVIMIISCAITAAKPYHMLALLFFQSTGLTNFFFFFFSKSEFYGLAWEGISVQWLTAQADLDLVPSHILATWRYLGRLLNSL